MIVTDSRFVDLSRSFGKNARPCDREAMCIDAEGAELLHVIFVTVILVNGNVGVFVIMYLVASFVMAIAIPDAFTLAILVPSSFYLKSACVGSPEKIFSHTFLLLHK